MAKHVTTGTHSSRVSTSARRLSRILILCLIVISAVKGQNLDAQYRMQPLKNIIEEGQLLKVTFGYADTPGQSLASFEEVPYEYVRGKIYSSKFNVTVEELLQHKEFVVRIYTHAYRALMNKEKVTNLPVQASRQFMKDTFPVLFKLKNDSSLQDTYIRKRIEVNLLHSGNITNPEDPVYKMYGHSQNGYFAPTLDVSQFWILKKQLVPLEQFEKEHNKTVEVEFSFNLVGITSIMFTSSMQQQSDENPVFKAAEEQIKELFATNSIEYLIFLFSTAILHMVFQTLAYKNDFQYWNSVKNFEGVSLSTLWWEFGVTVIQILYFWDQKFEGMPIYFMYMSFLMSCYRIGKVHFKGFKASFPFIKIELPQTYSNKTQGLEGNFVKKLMMFVTPCLGGYILYSYFTAEKKPELYSFVLSTTMKFLAAFSFVQMTPQIYINYVCKSVPVMPWRTLIYKFLDATVDDLFNIAMGAPTLTTIMHLSDDVVFVLLMIQRYRYGTDKNRTEKGYVAAPPVEDQKSSSTPQAIDADKKEK